MASKASGLKKHANKSVSDGVRPCEQPHLFQAYISDWEINKGLQSHSYNFPLQSDYTSHYSKGIHCCFSPSPIPTYSTCCSWTHVSLLACRNSCSSAKYWSDSSTTEEFVSRSPANAKKSEKFKDLPNLGKHQSKPHTKQSKQPKVWSTKMDNEKNKPSCQARDLLRGLWPLLHSFILATWYPLSFAVCCLDSHTTATSLFQGSTGHLWLRQGMASDKTAAPLLRPAMWVLGLQLCHTST